ncbi:MAG: Cys-Gln thioester bond-forming surface protein [Clostridia bacterium]|nr:Cys-Gln thioester bond-forming surface protein [Clostridia bacterium]
MKTKMKKSVALLMLLITIISSISNIAFASTEITGAELRNGGQCDYHLQFFDTNQNAWSYIITTFVYYTENGVEYPAYCLDRTTQGVGEAGEYGVDVTSLIEDVRIWRLVINSYPYQSPEALGLDNKYDAFVATKQAIYSVIYGWNPSEYYRGGDETGERIKNAIVRLVDIAYNGSQTPENTNISINKVGGIFEDGAYYSQKFNVTSPIETSIYTIIATAGLPDGSRITDLAGNDKIQFGGNEEFKVQIPKDKFSSDIDIKVNARAKCKTYPMFYGKSRIAGRQDYLLTFDPYGDIAGTGNLNVKTNTGKIQINKTDSETSKAIEGVTFELYKADGTLVGSVTTDKNGKASFDNLYQGKYKLKETKTNKDYILNKVEFNVDVEYNKTTTMDIQNDHQKGNLKIYKVDKDNNRVVLGNVEFDLYSEELQKVIGTYKTDVNGEIEIKNLRTGNYRLIEKNTNKWYNLSDETPIEVKWNKTEEKTIENELKKGKVKVIKVDLDNKEVKIPDVEFQVLDKNGNVLETIKTDKNGEATTKDYPIRDYDTLTIKETKTGKWYKLNEKPQKVTLKENEITTITFTNEKKKGQIKVIKVDLDNNEVKIPDVEFKVYDQKGNVVDTLKTDKNGEATSKRLPIDQEYKVQETKTGKWYKLNEKAEKVTLKEDEITTMTFTNEKRKGQIQVIKTDGETEVKLEGVTFVVEDSKGNIVDKIVTDKNGEATTKKLAIDEKYKVYEESTKKGYVLSEEKQVVELTEDEITTLTFKNYKEYGSIKIIKTSSDGQNIEGIEFKVTGKTLTGEDYEATFKTNEKGEIFIDEVLTGEYTIEELKGEINSNYTIPDIQKVVVEDKKTTEVKFFNQLIETPNTSDGRKIGLAISLTMISISGIGLLIIKRKKAKKTNKK